MVNDSPHVLLGTGEHISRALDVVAALADMPDQLTKALVTSSMPKPAEAAPMMFYEETGRPRDGLYSRQISS
jgi:hypothetical protein